MKIMVIIFSLVALGPLAWASGSTIGNGGQGVYCPATNKIELFDFYEAGVLRGITPDLGNATLTYREKVDLVLKRLDGVDPVRAHLYENRFADFASEANFVSDSALTPVPDANAMVLPDGCQIVQLALQKKPSFPGEAYYLIDKNKWNLMDSDQQAGLILHEIIYREAIEMGATDSEGARYLNSTIATADFASISRKVYNTILVDIKLPRYTVLNTSDRTQVIFEPNIIGASDIASMDYNCSSVVQGARVITYLETSALYSQLRPAAIDWFGASTSPDGLSGNEKGNKGFAVPVLLGFDVIQYDVLQSPQQTQPLCIWDRSGRSTKN